MFLNQFFTAQNSTLTVSPAQASRFAKEIAGDFNPIHDADSKRFCVPGDLLFSLVLGQYGLSQKMQFKFSGMVGKGVSLEFAPTDAAAFAIADQADKEYLSVARSGAVCTDATLLEPLIRQYVAFSGQNFPYVLVPLMADKQVMINPDRPMVIYEEMSLELDRFDLKAPTLRPAENRLEVNGKRGHAFLQFEIADGDAVVGRGYKKLILSGLRPFDAEVIDQLSRTYLERKEAYLDEAEAA